MQILLTENAARSPRHELTYIWNLKHSNETLQQKIQASDFFADFLQIFSNLLYNIIFFITLCFYSFLYLFFICANDLIKNRWALMYVSGLFADFILIMNKSRELGWWLSKMDKLGDKVAIGNWNAGKGIWNIHFRLKV